VEPPRLSKLEMAIMEVLWTHGPLPVRDIQGQFPKKGRPAYNTIQTTISRMEGKKVVAFVTKLGNAHIYQAAISRDFAQRRLMDDLIALFSGQALPLMSYLIDAGKLTLKDVEEAERRLRATGLKRDKA
jgi:BlaI family penicillinase repressor